jgi:hypothetical protein
MTLQTLSKHTSGTLKIGREFCRLNVAAITIALTISTAASGQTATAIVRPINPHTRPLVFNYGTTAKLRGGPSAAPQFVRIFIGKKSSLKNGTGAFDEGSCWKFPSIVIRPRKAVDEITHYAYLDLIIEFSEPWVANRDGSRRPDYTLVFETAGATTLKPNENLKAENFRILKGNDTERYFDHGIEFHIDAPKLTMGEIAEYYRKAPVTPRIDWATTCVAVTVDPASPPSGEPDIRTADFQLEIESFAHDGSLLTTTYSSLVTALVSTPYSILSSESHIRLPAHP